MVVPSYAQNGEADVQVMQIRECFDHILDSETLSQENLARFDLGNGVAPDELSMLKGLTLWSLDMKDYHQRTEGLDIEDIFGNSFVIASIFVIPALLASTNFLTYHKVRTSKKTIILSKFIVSVFILSAIVTFGSLVTAAKGNKSLFRKDITNQYLLTLMQSSSIDIFWEQLSMDIADGKLYRDQILVGCNNVASLKKYLSIEPDRILTDFSDRNEASDLKPIFRTQDGQSFVMDDKIITKIAQELEKDKINVPTVADLLEQATDTAGTANSASSTLPRARSNIAENPITTCVGDLSGIYQVKDLKTQKTSYWKIQSQYGSKESYQIAVNVTNDFSNPTWITASVGQILAPSANVNHCGITYYDDLSAPSIYLILKYDSSKIMLGASPMRTMTAYEMVKK